MSEIANQTLLRKTALVICNPTAGSKSDILSLTIRKLKHFGMSLNIQETKSADHATQLCKKAIEQKPYDCILAAGGDGTINQVTNNLIGTNIPLGIIPAGTANVLATEIKLPSKSEFIAQTIAFGKVRSIFCGNSNDQIFLLMASVGFDSHVVAKVSRRLKNIFGKGAYVLTALKQLFEEAPCRLKVTIDGEIFESTWAIISKGVHYAGEYIVAPEADLSGKELVITLFEGESKLETVRYLYSIGFGQGDFKGKAKVLRGTRVSIEGDAPVQLDGDHVGSLPISISVVPDPLHLIVPNK